jgi:hypothetical protein
MDGMLRTSNVLIARFQRMLIAVLLIISAFTSRLLVGRNMLARGRLHQIMMEVCQAALTKGSHSGTIRPRFRMVLLLIMVIN